MISNVAAMGSRLQQQLQQCLQIAWFRILVNAGGAALLWGCWAAFVQRHYDLHTQITAALTQAFISAFFTLIGATVLETIFARSPKAMRVPAAALGTFTFIFASVVTLHTLSGTPDIVLTIAPTMTLSFFYCFGYATSLKKIALAT